MPIYRCHQCDHFEDIASHDRLDIMQLSDKTPLCMRCQEQRHYGGDTLPNKSDTSPVRQEMPFNAQPLSGRAATGDCI